MCRVCSANPSIAPDVFMCHACEPTPAEPPQVFQDNNPPPTHFLRYTGVAAPLRFFFSCQYADTTCHSLFWFFSTLGFRLDLSSAALGLWMLGPLVFSCFVVHVVRTAVQAKALVGRMSFASHTQSPPSVLAAADLVATAAAAHHPSLTHRLVPSAPPQD